MNINKSLHDSWYLALKSRISALWLQGGIDQIQGRETETYQAQRAHELEVLGEYALAYLLIFFSRHMFVT